jgi:hypothetical protein
LCVVRLWFVTVHLVLEKLVLITLLYIIYTFKILYFIISDNFLGI